MKKIGCAALSLLLFFAVLSPAAATTLPSGGLPGVYVDSYSTGGGIIQPGNVVSMQLNLAGYEFENQSAGGMFIAIDQNSAFRFSGGNVTESINQSGTPLLLQYDGTSRNFSFTIYTDTATYPLTVYVSEAIPTTEMPTQPTQPTQPDPSTLKPVLGVTGDVPVLQPGQPANLTLYINNRSGYAAENIYCTFTAPDGTLYPSAVSNRFFVGRVDANGSIPLTIPVMVDADAAPGYASISLAFEFTNAYGAAQTHSEKIGVNIGGTAGQTGNISINVGAAHLDRSTIGSDNSVTLTLEIQNTGTADAQDVEVSLDGYSAKGFTLNDTVGVRRLGVVAAGSRAYVQFPLRVANELESGSHSLKANIQYKSGKEKKTVAEDVFLNITRNQSAGLSLDSAKLNTNTPGSSSKVKLTLGLKNGNDGDISNVKVFLEGLSTAGFTLDGTFGSKNVSSMKAGGTTSVTFPLYVADAMVTGNYPLKVVMEYLNASGTVQKAETEIYLYINKPDKKADGTTTGSTPRVIIESYELGSDLVESGVPFDFHFTLKNTSKKTPLRNIKVVVQSKDGIFVPAQGSNSFFADSIAVDGSLTLGLEMVVAKRDAESKSYPIEIVIDYEDADNKPYTVTEQVSVPVTQEQRLEVSNFQYEAMGMSPSYLSMQYVNKGRGVLYNMSIRIEGPFAAENGVLYVGNMAAGSSDFFEDMITPTETGDLSGKVIFSYEDINGNVTEYEQEFTASVAEEIFPPDGGMIDGGMPMPMEPEQSGVNWPLILIIGGVVLLGGGAAAFILVRRARRKKKELVLDE